MSNNQEVKSISDKYDLLSPYLNEKTRRIWAAIEARSLGWGGISQVAIATGLSRTTIHAGIRLLSESDRVTSSQEDSTRIRVSGGGGVFVAIVQKLTLRLKALLRKAFSPSFLKELVRAQRTHPSIFQRLR